MVAEMTTPQLTSAAPEKLCPKCGRRMQLLSVSESGYHYACYSHTLQNAGSSEPFYLNVWFKSLDANGKVKVKDTKG